MKNFKQFNESIRDKMTPKSEEEREKAFEKISEEIADILTSYYDFEDFLDAVEWAENNKKKIIELREDGVELEDIVKQLIYGWDKNYY